KTSVNTLMMGDLGTGDDLITPRPDTLKMVAPTSDINDDNDARPFARPLNALRPRFHGRPRWLQTSGPILHQPDPAKPLVHPIARALENPQTLPICHRRIILMAQLEAG